jgi:hypothetical protein
MRPSASISIVDGNSSNMTKTTGTSPSTAVAAELTSCGSTSLDTGETSRKRRARTTGAGESTLSPVRTAPMRAYASALAAPTIAAAISIAGAPRSATSFIAWRAIAATRIATASR